MTGKTGSISALSPVIPAPQKIRQYSAYNLLNKGLYSIGYLYDFSGIPLYSEKALPSPCIIAEEVCCDYAQPAPPKNGMDNPLHKALCAKDQEKNLVPFLGKRL